MIVKYERRHLANHFFGSVAQQAAESHQHASERRLAAVVDYAADAIISKDLTGTIQTWNRAAERMFGYTPEEIIGQSVLRLIPADRIGEEHRILARIMSGECVERFESVRQRKDGSLFNVLLTVSPILDANDRVIGASKVIHDITDRTRAENNLHLQYAIARTLGRNASLEDAARSVLEQLCYALNWDHGALWAMDHSVAPPVLCFREQWQKQACLCPNFSRMTRQCRFAYGDGLPGRVWKTGQAIWIDDVTTDTEFVRREVAKREGLHSAFALPIQYQNEFMGVIEFVSQQIIQPDQDLLDLMGAIANQFGQFVYRKQVEQALQKASSLKQAILDNADCSVVATMPDGLITVFNRAAEHLVSYTAEEVIGKMSPLVFHDHRELAARAGELSQGIGRTIAPGFDVFIVKLDQEKAEEREWTYA